ncbi:MAG: glycosyltransferase [Hyphomicrobiaceae bacterium]
MASVDVVVPSYNYGHYLRDCIESILSQDVDRLRLLIIDNASTDDSLTVASKLAQQDNRIEIVAHHTNLGPHASFNEGIDWARSEYFIIVCADDLLAPGALRRAIDLMENQLDVSFLVGVEISLTNEEIAGQEFSIAGEESSRIISGLEYVEQRCAAPGNLVTAGAVVVRTSTQKKAGYYRPSLPYTDDFEMLLRLATLGQVATTSRTQGVRREHEGNMSKTFWRERIRDLVEREAAFSSFFANEGKSLPNAAVLAALARKNIAAPAYWSAISHSCRGRFREAGALFRFAFNHSPISIIVPPIGYLISMPQPFRRVTNVLLEALGLRTETS